MMLGTIGWLDADLRLYLSTLDVPSPSHLESILLMAEARLFVAYLQMICIVLGIVYISYSRWKTRVLIGTTNTPGPQIFIFTRSQILDYVLHNRD